MKNLRELFTLYPLGCESFGAEWLRRWEGIGRLLQKPAQWQVLDTIQGGGVTFGANGESALGELLPFAIRAVQQPKRAGLHHRVVLLDGTVVYEWGPK